MAAWSTDFKLVFKYLAVNVLEYKNISIFCYIVTLLLRHDFQKGYVLPVLLDLLLSFH